MEQVNEKFMEQVEQTIGPEFWAATYDKYRWPIIPITQGLVLISQATTSVDQTLEWLRSRRDIAVPTGRVSHIVALEFSGDAGLDKLDLWLRRAFLPDTLSVDAGKTRQLLYACGDRSIPTRRIGRGVDLLGENSYVILPPSSDGCGRYCCFDDPDITIAALPRVLLEAWAVDSGDEGDPMSEKRLN